jgi:Amiloride-sensitive sodium channel
MQSQRAKLYGRTDFMANCGGLLGLGLGVSVISFLEIAYFCSIRLCCKLRSRDQVIDRSQGMIVEELRYFRRKGSVFFEMVRNLIIEYSTKTTIQGVKYVADSRLSRVERVWWVIIVMISVVCCGSQIFDVLRRYDQFPLIISYANVETSVTQVLS